MSALREWLHQAHAHTDFLEAENAQLKGRVAELQRALSDVARREQLLLSEIDALRVKLGERLGGGIDVSVFRFQLVCDYCGEIPSPGNYSEHHICRDRAGGLPDCSAAAHALLERAEAEE